MSDVVFILGAGASKDGGAPTMPEFLDTSNQLFRTGMVNDVRKDFERVFEGIGALCSAHSKAALDLVNEVTPIFWTGA